MKHLLCAVDLSDQKDAQEILMEADRLSGLLRCAAVGHDRRARLRLVLGRSFF